MNRAFPGEPEGAVTSQIAHYLTHGAVSAERCGHRHPLRRPQHGVRAVRAHAPRRRPRAARAHVRRDARVEHRLRLHLRGHRRHRPAAGRGGESGQARRHHGNGRRRSASPPACIASRRAACAMCSSTSARSKAASRRAPASASRPPFSRRRCNREDYLLAPESGIFEIAVDLGAKVKRGQTVGFIHHLERPDRAPEADRRAERRLSHHHARAVPHAAGRLRRRHRAASQRQDRTSRLNPGHLPQSMKFLFLLSSPPSWRCRSPAVARTSPPSSPPNCRPGDRAIAARREAHAARGASGPRHAHGHRCG